MRWSDIPGLPRPGGYGDAPPLANGLMELPQSETLPMLGDALAAESGAEPEPDPDLQRVGDFAERAQRPSSSSGA